MTWAKKKKKFADIKNNMQTMQKHKIFLAILKNIENKTVYIQWL